jgi:hypothetical protein
MPRALHFHIAAGSASGAIYSIAEYTSGPKSVVDFLDLSYQLYGKSIPVGRLQAESKLNSFLEKGEETNVQIGQDTPIMLVWSVCTCDVIPLLN